jgi:hypothetical protein
MITILMTCTYIYYKTNSKWEEKRIKKHILPNIDCNIAEWERQHSLVFRWQVRINERGWKRELGSQQQIQISANYYSQGNSWEKYKQAYKKHLVQHPKQLHGLKKRLKSNKNCRNLWRITSESRRVLQTSSINWSMNITTATISQN